MFPLHGAAKSTPWMGILGLSEQVTPVACSEYVDRTKVFKKTKSQPLINRKRYTVSNVHFLSCVLVSAGKNGFSVEGGRHMLLCGLEKGQCSYDLPTPYALRCCDILTGVLTLGFDLSCQGCQSAGTGHWEKPVGLGLSSTCLAKHLWLL